MNKVRLLIVEDDETIINLYQQDIKRVNQKLSCEIVASVKKGKDQALEILNDRKQNFDAAIIDLKLDNDAAHPGEYSGNEVISIIKNSMRFPIYVISSNTEQISSDFVNLSPLFQVIRRDERDSPIEDLVKLCLMGVSKILGYDGQFEKYLHKIFWEHLSSNIENWSSVIEQAEENEKSIFRYVLSTMYDYVGESIEHYHPAEFFIQPPVKKGINTGGVITFKNQRYLVLTPACDLENDKAEHILFCRIVDINSIYPDVHNLTRMSGNDKKNKFKRHLDNTVPRFHFIPKTNTIAPGFVDFQQKKTLSHAKVEKHINKGDLVCDAKVSVHFFKDIVSRYSTYYARQGSPDFDAEKLYESIMSQ